MADFDRESMLEMFTFESGQLIEQMETSIVQDESGFTIDQINEIFRAMHTIKGSAAMMMFDSIATVAHSIEDMFFYLRDGNPDTSAIDYGGLTDIVLEGIDFIKNELYKVGNKMEADGDGEALTAKIKLFLNEMKGGAAPAEAAKKPAPAAKSTPAPAPIKKSASGNVYKITVHFTEGCEMENVRAYNVVNALAPFASDMLTEPKELLEEEASAVIKQSGLVVQMLTSKPINEIKAIIKNTVYLKDYDIDQVEEIVESADKRYQVSVRFSEDAEMENIHAYALVHHLMSEMVVISTTPQDVVDEAAVDVIKASGFSMLVETSKTMDELRSIVEKTPYIRDINIVEALNEPVESTVDAEPQVEEEKPVAVLETKPTAVAKTDAPKAEPAEKKAAVPATAPAQTVISVNVSKLDHLLNLMGELVISEAMVTQNPDLDGLELENFHKETRQLRKIIKDLQETVMSMRMVPLSTTFFKMHRIVRDMCRSLGKDVQLTIIGEETEVDKNISEHISDPLMHIIRNSIDHGIELPEERKAKGKKEKGNVILEAKNTGGDILIIVKDDGQGLDRDAILRKAKNNGLLRKPESDYTDKEIQQFILLPGFSTNEKVTEYSGRGVGMDVVSTNLASVGGTVIVDSVWGEGSTFTLKIPLTLAIIDGMQIKMGNAKFTVPIISIKQSFKATKDDIFSDPDGNEMIYTRGEVFNVVRLYEFFNMETDIKNIEDGILIMLENSDKNVCLMADDLLGVQQVVVKSIPKFLKKCRGISGCTQLGNGDISLILDVAGFFD